MNRTSNRILDDLSRLFTDAAGARPAPRREVETVMRAQFERFMRDMDMVSREEFEAQRDLAVAAREEAESLARRLADLEARVARLEGAQAPAAAEHDPVI